MAMTDESEGDIGLRNRKEYVSQTNAEPDGKAAICPDENKGQREAEGHGKGEDKVVLKRQIGLTTGISLMVGIIIGSGIFVSPKGVLNGAGSVGLSFILWTVGGIISMFAALSYAELGLLMPVSGGDYIYISRTYGGMVGFLWLWTQAAMLRPAGLAIMTVSCARYILVPIYNDNCGDPPDLHMKLLALLVLALLVAVNSYSVELASRIQVIFTVAKLVALLLIIIGGIVKLAQGNVQHLNTGFEGTNTNFGQIITGLYSAMYAYSGWQYLTYVAEELIEPEKNILRVMLIAMPLVMCAYLLTIVSYFTVMSPSDLLASPAVGVTWAEAVIPAVSWIIPLSVALSTFGTSNGSLFATGRLYFSGGREGQMLKILAMVNAKKMTPMPAVAFCGAISVIYIFVGGGVQALINLAQFAMWFFVGLAMLAVFILRHTMKDTPRVFKVPLFFPAIVFVMSVVMVVSPVAQNPQMGYLYAVLIILGGLIFYFPFVYFKKELPCMGALNTFLQLLLQVTATESS